MPAVVRRGALSEEEMAAIAALTQDAAAKHGSTHRTFGVTDGTTGHNVTWLTPLIYEHAGLLQRLRALVGAASVEGRWALAQLDGLSIRCAEHLEYAGGGVSTGLGWHWDLGSAVTMVLMLDSSGDAQNGKLQVSSECSTHDVLLERGDVAIYRSHQRHRVTSVTKRRSVVVVEWWRGEPTQRPIRPGAEASVLMEPATRDLRLSSLASSTLRRALEPWGSQYEEIGQEPEPGKGQMLGETTPMTAEADGRTLALEEEAAGREGERVEL